MQPGQTADWQELARRSWAVRRAKPYRWRPVRWLRLTATKGWRLEQDLHGRPNVLVSPRGTRYEFRQGWARWRPAWWQD